MQKPLRSPPERRGRYDHHDVDGQQLSLAQDQPPVNEPQHHLDDTHPQKEQEECGGTIQPAHAGAHDDERTVGLSHADRQTECGADDERAQRHPRRRPVL